MPDAWKSSAEPLGQEALRRALGLRVPPPVVQSFAHQGARRTEMRPDGTVIEWFPRSYLADDSTEAAIRFALRYEPLDARCLVAALRAIEPAVIEDWVRREPTGAYSRRAWFLFERLTGHELDLPDVRAGSYVDALNPRLQVVADARRSPRHRVYDNLLGGPGMCITVRRTIRLREQQVSGIDERARALVAGYDTSTLARAVSYLFTKETRSSFAIEGETPSSSRAERFARALRDAPSFDLASKAALIELQNQIVDPRYAADDWRDCQNFVGETIGGYREKVHFICPRPEDVPSLMQGWMEMVHRLLTGSVDPVVAAAAASFAFVFVHPFEDGNGRIHRFLIHSILARRGFGPEGIVFPVSASILRTRHLYDAALEGFSQPLFDAIDWHFDAERELVVENDTADLYRYFDATSLAEYLYDRVADTVAFDLTEELGFIAVYDRALTGVLDVVDMPDRRASLFVRLCMQNGGRLSANKRCLFDELEDEEIRRMEDAVEAAIQAEREAHPPALPHDEASRE